MASPTSIKLPLKIATWAQRAAAGPQTIAPAIAPGIGNGETRVIAEAAPRACVELTGGSAMTAAQEASIAALPPGPRRELEVATWARRIAGGPKALAFTVDLGTSVDEIAVIARLTAAARELLGGAR